MGQKRGTLPQSAANSGPSTPPSSDIHLKNTPFPHSYLRDTVYSTLGVSHQMLPKVKQWILNKLFEKVKLDVIN